MFLVRGAKIYPYDKDVIVVIVCHIFRADELLSSRGARKSRQMEAI